MNAERAAQVEQAIKEYFKGSLAREVCAKFKIDNTSLVRQIRKRSLVPRTKAESAAIKFGTKQAFQKENGEWVKICRDCNLENPIAKYQPDKEYTDGRGSVCYDCRNKRRRPRQRQRYAEDSEYREQIKRDHKKRNDDNPGLTTIYHRKVRFKMTLEDFDNLLCKQGGVCAACGSSHSGAIGKDWGVDHDHACCSGKKTCGKCVRGILCNPCNLILGLAKDNPKILDALASYLRNYVPYPAPQSAAP